MIKKKKSNEASATISNNNSVSCYNGVDPANYLGEKPLQEVFKLIRSVPILTEKRIRDLKKKLATLKAGSSEYKKTRAKYEEVKEQLFSFTPSGICRNGRNNRDLTNYTGLIVADFDGLPNEKELKRVFNLLKKDEHVRGAWRSVGGDGIKALIQGNPDIKLHHDNFFSVSEHLKKLTGYEIDPKCRNIARISFIAYDPHLYENKTPVPIKLKPKKKVEPVAQIGQTSLARFKEAIEKDGTVGRIEWTEDAGKPIGICRCPDPVRHHPKATIHLSGIPNLYCHHEQCSEEVKSYNAWLRIKWASAELYPWVWVSALEKFVNVDSEQEMNETQFNKWMGSLPAVKGKAATFWSSQADCRKFEAPVYLPRQPQFVTQRGLPYLNTWKEQTEVTAETGDVSPFIHHVEYVVPNKEEREVFLDWLAWQVQNPGKKILWALLLQGDQRIGKSYFGDIMVKLLGRKNVSCPSNNDVHEPWTSWAKQCSLVIIEELMGRERFDLLNKFKPIITEPFISIREMYHAPYAQPNVFNILIFTNHKDALPLDEDDKRYYIIYSTAIKQSSDYYGTLWEWTREHYGRILDYFLKRNLGEFNPHAAPAMTGAKLHLIRNMTPLHAWMSECIENQAWPFHGDIIGTMHLMDCLPRYVRGATMTSVGRALKAVGARELYANAPLKAGGFARLLCVRNYDLWVDKDRETVLAEYERWSMAQEPGGNPLKEAKPM